MSRSQHPTAVTLRWRARLEKSAAAYNSLDSISVQGDDNDKKEPEDPTTRWQEFRRSTVLSSVDGIAVLAVAASLLTLQSFPLHIICTIAAILTAGLGGYLSYQNRTIRKLRTLRRLQNELRYDMNVMQLQNQQLKKKLLQLTRQGNELDEVESDLRKCCNNDTNLLRRMVSQVEQKRQVNSQMRKVLQDQVMQIILRVAAESNREQELFGSLSPSEVEVVLIRLQQVQGIEVNEGRLRALLETNRSLRTLLKITILTKEKEGEDWIIRVHNQILFGK